MVSGHYEIIVDEFLITLLKMPGLTIYPYFFSSIPNKSKGFDYCYDSSAPGGSINIPTPRPTPGPTRGVDTGDGAGLRTIGRDGCGPNGCGECEGDCDFDGDCAGDLRCFQRLGLEAVPGCGGIGGGQNGKWPL